MGVPRSGDSAVMKYKPGRRLLTSYEVYPSTDNSDEFAVSLSDTVFEFLEEGQGFMKSTYDGSEGSRDEADASEEEDEEGAPSERAEENKAFWENQHKLLQENLFKTSSMEKRIRNAAKEALKAAQNEGNFCDCGRPMDSGTCRNCVLREMSSRLRAAGYDSGVCNTKWRNSIDIPSGEHTFLDVIDRSSSKKGDVRVIIELSFRGKFEIGRASEEYKQLVSRLPEAFVGKAEKLKAVIKILCSAAKKCMKDNKMHMGPWRKQKYMLAKWFGPCKRTETVSLLPSFQGLSLEPSKPRGSNSLLTVALLDMTANVHLKAVEVV